MDYETIRYEPIGEHVVQLVLDRPRAANALSQRTFAELDDALGRIEADDDVRVWLLTGAPRDDGRPWFSAGADLKEVLEPPAPAPAPAGPVVDPATVIDRIDDLLTPSIAVIAGFCTTGALGFVMACDLRIASHSARLSDRHLRATGLGIGRWGAAVRLSRLVGVDKAKELLLTGVEIDGRQAERIGLVNRAVPDDELVTHALEVAEGIAALPRRGVRTTLGFLGLQADMAKHEALRWAGLTPPLMGLELRPVQDAAERFFRRHVD